MNKDNMIPALDKALSLLEHLGRNSGGSTQAELSAKLGITQSTCYRILQTLLRHDFVKKQAGSRFDISSGLLAASMRLADSVRRFDRAQPLLDSLSSRTGFSSKLSIRQGFEQLSILRAESPLAVSVSGKIGARFPLIEGSVGAALLCAEEPAAIHELAKACQESIDEATDITLVLKRVAELRERGYALNATENRWNVEALSAPVRDSAGGVAAALTLIGFKDEFKDVPALARELVKTAKDVSSLI
jgi:DNA-binding IclR family transcriptional regulator